MNTIVTAPVEVLGLVNHDAEIAAIHAMRRDTEVAIQFVQELAPSDFYDTRRSIVFEAIGNILRGVEELDTSTILAEARSVIAERKEKVFIDEPFLNSLVGGDPRRAAMYSNTIRRLAWLRSAGGFAFWLVQELQLHPDPDGLFAAAQEKWQELQPKKTAMNFVYGWDTIRLQADTINKRVRELEEGKRLTFSWPWKAWNDKVTLLRAGFVGIVAAPDGQGKTTYLEMVAEHWAVTGFHVVYVHLEDDLDYKLDRRLARQALVTIDEIENGRFTADAWQKVKAANERMAGWADTLHYYHAPGESMATIIRELETRVSEGVCQAVVFDYLDKVQPTRTQGKFYGENTWERQANDMEMLKSFAERNHLPVLTATQGNKAMQGEGTQTRKNIQGSGQKSQKAQLVIILTRDIVGESGLRDRNGSPLAEPGEYSPVVKVRVDKQNRGATCNFEQVLVGKYFTVRDIERRA